MLFKRILRNNWWNTVSARWWVLTECHIQFLIKIVTLFHLAHWGCMHGASVRVSDPRIALYNNSPNEEYRIINKRLKNKTLRINSKRIEQTLFSVDIFSDILYFVAQHNFNQTHFNVFPIQWSSLYSRAPRGCSGGCLMCKLGQKKTVIIAGPS